MTDELDATVLPETLEEAHAVIRRLRYDVEQWKAFSRINEKRAKANLRALEKERRERFALDRPAGTPGAQEAEPEPSLHYQR